MTQELSFQQLRLICEQDSIGCFTSSEITKLDAIIGQQRAVKALKFGLGIHEKGFNIFVSGMPGTGRTSAVRLFLEEIASSQPTPDDWCYVNNFQDSSRPKTICLPAGKAQGFKTDIKRLVESIEVDIRSLFESEEYAVNRDRTVKTFQLKKEELIERVNKNALEKGFIIQANQMGVITIPVKDGKPISEEDYMALKPEEKEKISHLQEEVQEEIATSIRASKQLDKSILDAIQKTDREAATFATSHLFEDLKDKYKDVSDVIVFLGDLQDDILNNLGQFRADPNQEQGDSPAQVRIVREMQRRRYEVAVVVDNSNHHGAPVILETNPTYNNLLGTIEHEAQFGTLVTDFTLIRGGALHKANGGYLVLPVEEVLRNTFAWDSLKRSLEAGELTIEDASDKLGFVSTKSLHPYPIPLDIKVILIGQPQVYQLLQAYDQNFSELFKVKADFDLQMERTPEHIQEYVAFISKICNAEKLRHLDASAMAKIVEHGSRLADSQEKLSTHFGVISDVIREANYYAAQEVTEFITSQQIMEAIEERFYRSSLVRERMQEMIRKNIIKIDIDGEKVGQVNGLSVIDLGDVSFGQPSRITINIGLGRTGIIDIERETQMGGPSHTKGVMILSGYLTQKFAQDRPLSLSASLVFEQNYSGVDGDSASSTELYCLLSALSGYPIKQGIAVTGSVNQKGEIQAIGGINQKIEGFFAVCKGRGLTGSQGVIMPESNVSNLMLKEEIVEAVKEGKFHVWPVSTVEEGIEILTGIPAGSARLKVGSFEPETVFGKADQRLSELAEKLVSFGKDNFKMNKSGKFPHKVTKKIPSSPNY